MMFGNKIKAIISMLLLIFVLLGTTSCMFLNIGDKSEESESETKPEPNTETETDTEVGSVTETEDTEEETESSSDTETEDETEEERYLTLYQNKAASFNIIYSADINTTLARYTDAKDFYTSLCFLLNESVGSPTAPKLANDKNYEQNDRIEIIWGKTACEESIRVYDQAALNEYGYKIVGNKIVIYGNTLDEIKTGAEALKIALTEGAYLDGNGNIVLGLKSTSEKKYTNKKLAIVELPVPEVGGEALFCDGGDDARTWIIEGCRMADFDTYTAELEKAGFELYAKNNGMNGSGAAANNKNVFATYTKGDVIADVWYTIDGYLRITASRGFDLPERSDGEYKKVGKAETGLTIVGPSKTVERGEMLMFFRLDDGSFFVIDGGTGNYMWDNLLAELEKQAPDPEHIVIKCWMLTHTHADHTGALTGLSKKMSTLKDKLTVESFMYNFAGYEQASVPNQDLDEKDMALRNTFAKYFAGSKKYKVHPGNEFDFANMHLEVLSTHENGIKDIYPEERNDCNLSVKIEIEGQTIIIMGDTGFINNPMLGEIYGDYLRCDILQAAHHGYEKGGTVEVNLLHAPEVVLFMANWNDSTYPMKNLIKKDFNQALVDTAKNPNFKEYICHDGVVTYLPLPYTPGTKVITSHAAPKVD